jgi:hypothetical protein
MAEIRIENVQNMNRSTNRYTATVGVSPTYLPTYLPIYLSIYLSIFTEKGPSSETDLHRSIRNSFL